jgi:hypothetical protein
MVGLGKGARVAGLAVAVASLGTAMGSDSAVTDTTDLPLFTISKSENKNEVQYVIRVDGHCVPAAGTPIWAYWRMLERGPSATEPLLGREQRAYGLASQSVSERTADGGKAVLTLMAVPSRPVSIETFRDSGGTCRARSVATVGGENAYLFNVYVKLKWPVGVSYLLLQGWSLDGARIVTEKLDQ